MADTVLIHNTGAYLAPVVALKPQTFTASGNSGSTNNGATIDRFKATSALYRSVDIVPVIRSSGSSKYKTTVTLRVQDSPTSTAWSAYGSASATPLVFGSTSATGKQTLSNTGGVSVDLGNARRYIRVNTIITWGGTNKSTNVTGGVVAVLGGADQNF